MDKFQRRRLHLASSKYFIMNTMLYRGSYDGLLLRCVDDKIFAKLLSTSHGSTQEDFHIGCHFIAKTIAHKILRSGFYWLVIVVLF